MSIIGRDANKNKKCFAACQPGTYCECLGKTIEEKDCGFSDISCILQHMSSVAKSEELVGNLQIAGDIECWVDQIRQLNTTTRPPVAGLAEWLPIESAPKDTAMILHDGISYELGHFNNLLNEWVSCWDHRKLTTPHHWMPLTPPPEIAKAAREFLGKVE